jgi:hypothetical protein
MWGSIQRNWKTNLIALAAFVYSVPQVVQTIQAWSSGQPANWKQALTGLLLAAGMAAAKDSTNHSTQQEVQVATLESGPAKNA